MGRNIIETLIGALVLLVAIGFIIFAYKSANVQILNNHYELFARFERADGISIGSEIRIGGIKVGAVSATTLEPKTYMARIAMNVSTDIKIPRDSSAQIVSDGLLGGKYVALVPGGDETSLQPHEEIRFTQSSVNIETLIGKLVFGGGDSSKSGNHTAPSNPAKSNGNTTHKAVPSL